MLLLGGFFRLCGCRLGRLFGLAYSLVFLGAIRV
jgi:hypothetical protein